MTKAIGIDLGTTYTCVAYMKPDNTVEVLSNHYGNKTTPSVAYFGMNFTRVGDEAVILRGADPKNAIFQVKRLMGKKADDLEIKKKNYPFEVIAPESGDANIRVTPISDGKLQTSSIYRPEQISALFIRYAKVLAEEHLGSEVTEAVVTVPANFNNSQRQATRDAMEIAGLKVLRIINEPTAAALAYGFEKKDKIKSRVILVYDLGGGTFDVSIVKMKGTEAEVKATAGLTFLGGEDFDYRLFEEAISQFKAMRVEVPKSREFALQQSCEQAKRTLSTLSSADIETFDEAGRKRKFTITRTAFEEMCNDLFEKTIDCVKDAIAQSGYKMDEIDDVVLVGGSTRIPRIQKRLQQFFSHKTLKFDIPPDHAVAHGAAILAASLSCQAIQDNGGGAVKLIDITPFSLGIAVMHDNMQVLIPKFSRYPTQTTKFFTNAEDNSTSLAFKIYEGERAIASQNNLLGKLSISCPPRPINRNDVETIFAIDEDGILSLHVKNCETGSEATMVFESNRIASADRDKMMIDAKNRAEEEAIQKAKMEARKAFSDALLRIKTLVRRMADSETQEELRRIVKREEKWIEHKDPSNADLHSHAKAIGLELAKYK